MYSGCSKYRGLMDVNIHNKYMYCIHFNIPVLDLTVPNLVQDHKWHTLHKENIRSWLPITGFHPTAVLLDLVSLF